MSKVVSAILLVLLTLGVPLALAFVFLTQPAEGSRSIATCPPGSYDIGISKDGNPICKLEPTGCPYGDSIPLGADCDKHAPQPVPVHDPAPIEVMEGK